VEYEAGSLPLSANFGIREQDRRHIEPPSAEIHSEVELDVGELPGGWYQRAPESVLTWDFIVTGVSYSGSATTTSPSVAGGLVSQVVVSPANGGITVEVKLSEPAGHYAFGLGHNEVGVMLS
jgi:hypothetical protein